VARLLVRWVDKPDVVPGRPNTKAFDVVIVAPDGWEWGALEGYPQYLKVDLPGIAPEEAAFLQDIQVDPDDPDADAWLTRRAWGIMSNRITPPIMAQLEAAYEANVPYVVQNPDDILNWIRRKLDNAPPAWGPKKDLRVPGQAAAGASVRVS
jgi:hypothetical protein